MEKPVLLAAVIGASGLKGAVKVKVFTASAEALTNYGVLRDKHGKKFSITALRPGKIPGGKPPGKPPGICGIRPPLPIFFIMSAI